MTASTGTPGVLGFAHVELSVRDLERSVRWYAELFGFDDVFRTRNAERGFSACALRDPASGTVLAFTAHDRVRDGAFTPYRVGLDHLSFRVADRAALDAWRERLDARGIPHSGIQSDGRIAAITFDDPDGIALELHHVVRSA